MKVAFSKTVTALPAGVAPTAATAAHRRAGALELRTRAAQEGRDVRSVIEDAVRQYLEVAAITDVEPDDVAATQTALTSELTDVSEWKDPPT